MPSLAAAEGEAAYQAKPVPRDPAAQAGTSLFFVALRDGELESYDLLMGSVSVEEAIALWRRYFEIDEEARPESVFMVPAPTGASHALLAQGGPRGWRHGARGGLRRAHGPYDS